VKPAAQSPGADFAIFFDLKGHGDFSLLLPGFLVEPCDCNPKSHL
jgi:hypothetical protein